MHTPDFSVKASYREQLENTSGACIPESCLTALQDLYDSMHTLWRSAGMPALPAPAPHQTARPQCSPKLYPLAAWLDRCAPTPTEWYCDQNEGTVMQFASEFWQAAAMYNAILNAAWKFA